MPETHPPVDTAALLAWVEQCNRCDLSHFRDFVVAGQRVGGVALDKLHLFSAHPQVFRLDADAVSLRPELDSPQRRTEAVARVVEDWRAQGVVSGWRDELYVVSSEYGAPPLLLVERAAASLFGVRKYGVHVNGYVRKAGQIHVWVARRARHLRVFPGLLDQFVAGGLGAGYSAWQTVLKECGEEAGVPEELAARARPVGSISYRTEYHGNLVRNVNFNYDLELPADFVPHGDDGEVEAFYLWPLEQLARTVTTSREFKPNANLVAIDFLLRHGYLSPEHPHYLALCEGLHAPELRPAPAWI